MRFYTRTGDEGQTSLYSGERVPKNAARVEAYGTVDELQACTGFARSLIKDDDINADLLAVEGVMGGIMAQLATIGERTWIVPEDVTNIEALCDKYTERLTASGWKPAARPGAMAPGSATHSPPMLKNMPFARRRRQQRKPRWSVQWHPPRS